jgi:hypothetical protein
MPKRERVTTPQNTDGVAAAHDLAEVQAELSPPATHQAAASSVAADAIAAPASPASNRDRFRAACMPSQVSCDLSGVQSDPGLRFSFQAMVMIVYPAQINPARRHVMLADGCGIAGVTVWNAHVNAFSSDSVGRMAHFTKMSLVIHNNNRAISMSKESTVTFSDGAGHFAHTWWNSFPAQAPTPAIHFFDCKDNQIVNISGILGSLHSETKMVRNEPKELLTMRIVDRTGIIQVRSWNHIVTTFEHLVDKPIRIDRVRVAAFANTKVGELLDGRGSVVSSEFAGTADLIKFWSE